MTLLTSSDPWTMGRSTGRIFEPRSSRWNGYPWSYMFYLLFVSKFLVMEALSFWKCGSVLESVFFSFLHGFLSFFRSSSCSVVFSLDITAGPAGGSRVKICHRLPRRLGRKRRENRDAQQDQLSAGLGGGRISQFEPYCSILLPRIRGGVWFSIQENIFNGSSKCISHEVFTCILIPKVRWIHIFDSFSTCVLVSSNGWSVVWFQTPCMVGPTPNIGRCFDHVNPISNSFMMFYSYWILLIACSLFIWCIFQKKQWLNQLHPNSS